MNAVLITGAAKRIGRALAKTLADHGFAVALHCHQSRDEAEALKAQIGGKTAVVQADLAALSQKNAAQLIAQASEALGAKLTCLINNASLFERDDAHHIDEKLWNDHININARAPVFLSHAFAQHTQESDTREAGNREAGNIIMLLDQKVWQPTPYFFSYTLSKMALWDATRLLAQAYAPHIRVNAIGPGPILPNAFQSAEQFEQTIAATPLKRSATPEEIAHAAMFILAQPSMTGQMIALDGGQHLAPRPESRK